MATRLNQNIIDDLRCMRGLEITEEEQAGF